MGTPVLVQRLERRLDEICEAIVSQMRKEFVEYAGVPDQGRLQHLVRTIAETFLALAQEFRGLTDEERQQFEGIGAESARHGITSASLQAGVRLAMRVSWLFAVEEARDMSPPDVAIDAVEEAALTLFNFGDELTRALSTGYEAYRERTTSAEGGADGLLGALLAGSPVDPEELRLRATAVGLDADRLYAVLVVGDASGDVALPHLAEAARLISGGLPGAILVPMSSPLSQVVVVCPTPTRAAWAKATASLERHNADRSVVVMVSDPDAGLERLHQLYVRTSLLIGLATTIFPGRQVVPVRDLWLYRLLGSSAEVRSEFLTDALGPLLQWPAARREPLLNTWDALYQTGGRAELAALSLHVHPKTISYRLRRLAEVTGLDPRVPADHLKLDLAIHVLKLSPGSEQL